MIRTKDIIWDLCNRELHNREIDHNRKEVTEYYCITGKDKASQQDYQAIAVYRNGYFETIINEEPA
jgi:hypothetical protein